MPDQPPATPDLRERVLAEIDDAILDAGGKGPEATRLIALRDRVSDALGPVVLDAPLTVDVIATALNAAQVKPHEIALGRDLRPVARRLIEHLPGMR